MKYLFFFLFIQFASAQNNFSKSFNDRYILIDVKINNEFYKFIFDTGAEISIYFDVNNKIEIDKKKFALLSDNYNKVDTIYFPKNKWSYFLPDYNILVNDNSMGISKKIPEILKENNIQGILGSNFIFKYDWILETDSRKLQMLKKKKRRNENDFFTFFINKKGFVNCDFFINENCYFSDKYLIDTGSLGFIDYTNIDCKSIDYVNNITLSTGINTKEIVTKKIVKTEFNIGNLKINSAPVTIHQYKDFTNLIGVDFFNSFKEVFFLFSENKILLKKRSLKTYSLFTPIIYNGRVYGFLEKLENNIMPFKKWVIGSNVELNDVEFQKLDFNLEFSEKF